MGTTVVLVPGHDDASTGLDGLGGTGKTQAAAVAARACLDSGRADLVVWVTASGRAALLTGYAQALRDIGVPDQGESPARAADRFLAWLSRTERPWLVVLDDLRDPAVAAGLWPRGPAGSVLVTAQRPDCAAEAFQPRVAGVGAFSPRESLAFLAAIVRADPGQRTGGVDVAQALAFLPVALGHAGAFMAETGLSCRDYHAAFSERRSKLGGVSGVYESIVGAAWSLSAELADQLPPRGMAGRALALAAMLAPGGIPGAVLTSPAASAYLTGSGSAGGDAMARAALQNLARAGLVTIDSGSTARTVLVHEVSQALARRYLAPDEAERAVRVAADAVAQVWSGAQVSPQLAQALRDCTARLQETAADLLWTPQCHAVLMRAGASLDAGGLSGPAAEHWQRMLEVSSRVLGPGHGQTGRIRDLLGTAWEAAGNLAEATAVREAALAEWERTLGTAHPQTVAAREVLARTYLAAGRAEDAVRLAEHALVTSERALGVEHPDSLAARGTLGRSYLGAGQLTNAEAEFQHVLEGRAHALGDTHPDTITARASLADVYRESGQFKQAIALGKRALAERERVLGPDHLETIAARGSLAAVYRSADKPKDAVKLYERTLADRERVQGPEHPQAIVARQDLALAYQATGKLGSAIAQYERALADSERVLGRDHPITRAARESLAAADSHARSVLGIELRSPRKPAAPSR